MTKVTVVSSFTAIPSEGKVELGEVPLNQTTIQELKEQIQHVTKIPRVHQMLWWRGYLLDQEESCLTEACVGVNQGEHVEAGAENLVVFLTTPTTVSY